MYTSPSASRASRLERSSKLEKIRQALELCQLGGRSLRLLMPSRRSSRQLMRFIQSRNRRLTYPGVKLVGLQAVPSTDLFNENFPVKDLVRDFALSDCVPGFSFDLFSRHKGTPI